MVFMEYLRALISRECRVQGLESRGAPDLIFSGGMYNEKFLLKRVFDLSSKFTNYNNSKCSA